jgi:hypothetical protein
MASPLHDRNGSQKARTITLVVKAIGFLPYSPYLQKKSSEPTWVDRPSIYGGGQKIIYFRVAASESN